MKFEEAFSTFDQYKHSIDEINRLYIMTPDIFLSKYRNSFLCPKCHKAQLSYNNAAIPYFKAFPKAVHEDGCDLKQDEMSAKATEKFAEDSKNVDLIQRQMTGILNDIFEVKSVTTATLKFKNTPDTFKTETSSAKKTMVKRLPRKRIDLPLRPEDYNCFKYYYGKVSLKWEKNKDTERYKLLLYHRTKHMLLCKISISEKVYKHISDEYKFPTQYNCGIIFMASATENPKIHYFNTYFLSSYHLLIRKENTPE